MTDDPFRSINHSSIPMKNYMNLATNQFMVEALAKIVYTEEGSDIDLNTDSNIESKELI